MKFLRACFFAVFAIFSCAGRSAPVLQTEGFDTYLDRFEKQSELHGKKIIISDLIIKFGETNHSNEVGYCLISPGGSPEITIDEATWSELDFDEREALVFHELGHCILKRKHKDGDSKSGVPSSMMSPYMLDGKIYSQNQDYYLDELFNYNDPD